MPIFDKEFSSGLCGRFNFFWAEIPLTKVSSKVSKISSKNVTICHDSLWTTVWSFRAQKIKKSNKGAVIKYGTDRGGRDFKFDCKIL